MSLVWFWFNVSRFFLPFLLVPANVFFVLVDLVYTRFLYTCRFLPTFILLSIVFLFITGPKTACRPKKVDALSDMKTVQVAAGLGHTLFLVDQEEKSQSVSKR